MTLAADENSAATNLLAKLEARTALVAIIGLGYVGLPLAMAAVRSRFRVLGFDIDAPKIEQLNEGHSYLSTVASDAVSAAISAGLFRATADFGELAACDVIVICVPTPLTKQREPDLSAVCNTVRSIAAHLRPEQLVVLESTTYPGTTREVVTPLLEAGDLASGKDFFVGFSPEREDPGNKDYTTADIPKVIAGDGPDASRLMAAFYGAIVRRIVPVSSTDAAEAVKITENIFRAVNIALVNELKVTFDALGIDIWEVIEAAKTKPFGYMPFYPGPGLGGHCIPIDPFYLTWKAREHDLATKFIELAGEINVSMPGYVIEKLAGALDSRTGLGLKSARILLVGMAYKKNVGDIRESPALKLLSRLERRGASVDYHDPHVPEIGRTREHPDFAGRKSVALDPEAIASYHALIVVTDHDGMDYDMLARHGRVIVDTRNAFGRRGYASPDIVKA